MVADGDVVVAEPAEVVDAGEVVPVGATVALGPVVDSVVAGEAGGLVQAVASSTITAATQPRRFGVPDIVTFKRRSINS